MSHQSRNETIRQDDRISRLMIQSLTDHAIYMVDQQGRVINWNHGAERIKGYVADDIVGHHFSVFYTPEDVEAGEPTRGLQIALDNGRDENEGWRVRKNGSRFWANVVTELLRDEKGIVIGFTKVVRDITEKRNAAEARSKYLAQHDELTRLPNRALLAVLLTQAIRYAEHDSSSLAVFEVDLDRFTTIKDTFGPEHGSQLVLTATRRLQDALREVDIIARIGDAQFAVIRIDIKQPTEAAALAQHLIDALSQLSEFAGQKTAISVSIGIALHPTNGRIADELLKNANSALYNAKAQGGSTFRFFAPEMNVHIVDRQALESDLRRAFGSEQFRLLFQPQFRCSTRALTGFEALLRWRHPVKGDIAPTEFIPIAEEIGLIGQLGIWVLKQACAKAATWPAFIRVAVNLSPAQFHVADLVVQIEEVLRQTGFAAHRLELEVTETILTDIKEALRVLESLRDLGVHITLDDFGTGYSSLGHLRSLPFEKLKIDRSFIQGLEVDSKARSLVRTVIALATNLDLIVVAEGVETERQLEILRSLQCGEAQGFLLGKPMTSEDVDNFIDQTQWANQI